MLGFRQRPIQPLGRRVRQRLSDWLGNRTSRGQRRYQVTIGDGRFKRLVLPDARVASDIAESLRSFGASGIYPDLIFERENEIWVEWVEGRRIDGVDDATVDAFARLFLVLYTRDPQQRTGDRAPFKRALHTDLRFLNEVGVLADPLYRDLDKLADDLAPSACWVGYDCSDAVLKNFLACGDGRVRCIDVESLAREQLIGSGVAKAGLHWLGPRRERLLSQLRAGDAPDFQSYLPFVELSTLASWTKSSFLEGRRRVVDPTLFERFRRDVAGI